MYFSLRRILLMVLVYHFVLPAPVRMPLASSPHAFWCWCRKYHHPCRYRQYSESLAQRLIEKITVYDEKLVIKFKSGLTVEVEA